MLKVQGLRLRPGEPESKLTKKLQRELGCEVQGFQVLRRSVDARKKEDVSFVYTLGVDIPHENQVLKKCRSKKVSLYTPPEYHFPARHLRLSQRPVIVGAGPAGLFCALMLARAGARPIVLERGRDVDTRTELVSSFWSGGELDPECNVQFGEGGAGTFSDGKLHTGVNNPRMQQILREFVAFGAPSEILWDANPHVGTDYLKIVVKNIRLELEKLGAEVRFSHRLTGILTEHGRVVGAEILSPEGAYPLKTGHLVLAIGHSARDTFRMLYDSGVPMEQKQFAMGVRIEQKQKDVTVAQFGAEIAGLPVATYKLSCHPDTGRGAFSFCVCPGGLVVAAASQPGRLCTNGMSNHARDEENINGGLLVTVLPSDFGTQHPLGGVFLQEQLEEAAFRLGGGNYFAPCQRVEDFLAHRPSTGPGKVTPSYAPGVTWTDLHQCLPEFLTDTLEQALPMLGKKLQVFDDPDAVLTAIESRSSSPVRIPRDETGQSSISGLYPCGEGAGYAGGIMSAAADGMKVAEKIAEGIF